MKWYQKTWLYIKQGVGTVASWFQKNPEVTNAALAIAAFDAGYLIATKKPEYAPKALMIVENVIARMSTGTQEEIINAAFQDGVLALVSMIKDPMIQMNLMSLLRMIKFDATNMNLPPLPITTIKDFVVSFRDGLKMGMAKTV